MSDVPETDSRAPALSWGDLSGAARLPQVVAFVIAYLGIAALTVLAVSTMGFPVTQFGSDIYDQMWLALREGRLDLPARTLRLEGHYAPDGTGYPYHGLAPLITRAVLDPFVTIGAAPLSAVSIWFWTILGTGFWHGVIWQLGAETWTSGDRRSRFLLGVLSVGIWFAGPALLLVSNHAMYHEPISLTYAAAAGFAYFWIRAERQGRSLAGVLILLALCAAVTVHARPNVAVGLYLATGFAILRALWQVRAKALLPAVIALGLLGASGLGYMKLNEARFGDSGEVHGSYEPGASQYGSVFWGYEKVDDIRPQGFIDHGRFNVKRILPNAVLYFFAPPQIIFFETYESLRIWFYNITEPHLGFIRVEGPGGGIFFLWTGWAVLALVGLGTAFGRAARPYWGLLAGLGASTLLTLSYGTVTLRYHIDMFPFFMVLAGLGIVKLAPMTLITRRGARITALVAFATIVATSVNLRTAVGYQHLFRQTEGSAFEVWSFEMCKDKATERGFGPDRIEVLCAPPRIETRS